MPLVFGPYSMANLILREEKMSGQEFTEKALGGSQFEIQADPTQICKSIHSRQEQDPTKRTTMFVKRGIAYCV